MRVFSRIADGEARVGPRFLIRKQFEPRKGFERINYGSPKRKAFERRIVVLSGAIGIVVPFAA